MSQDAVNHQMPGSESNTPETAIDELQTQLANAEIDSPTFKQFSRLPKELQIMTWEEFVSTPGGVSIRRTGNANLWRTIGVEDLPDLPNVRLTCSDLRLVIGDNYRNYKKFKHAFGAVDGCPKLFNFETDWLEIQSGFVLWFMENRAPQASHFEMTNLLIRDMKRVKNIRLYQEPESKNLEEEGWLPINNEWYVRCSLLWGKMLFLSSFHDLENLEVVYLKGEKAQRPSQDESQNLINSMWEQFVNPRRLPASSFGNPTPKVKVTLATSETLFDRSS